MCLLLCITGSPGYADLIYIANSSHVLGAIKTLIITSICITFQVHHSTATDDVQKIQYWGGVSCQILHLAFPHAVFDT